MEETFKELWKELCKQGWTPKPPTGLSNDHRYVRPGRSVRGKDGVHYFTGEIALLAFARQCGWLYYGVPVGSTSQQSSVATATSCESSQTPPTETAAVSTATQKPTLAATGSSTVPPGTTSPPVTSATAQAATTPPPGTSATAQAATTPPPMASATAQVDDEAEFNMYVSDQFLAALARHEWSNEAEDDDPNICGSECEEDEPDDVETDQQLEEVMNVEIDEEDEALSASECEFDDNEYFETVANEDWSPQDDANVNPYFITDDELKAIADAWIVYDQDHSSEFQVDSARDLYDGRWGPTQSARAFAGSPLGMFYYFMPKVMWSKIAEETNRYRDSVIESVAIQRQERQQRRQASHPNCSVQSLEEIRSTLSKMEPFQPHELVHYIALLKPAFYVLTADLWGSTGLQQSVERSPVELLART